MSAPPLVSQGSAVSLYGSDYEQHYFPSSQGLTPQRSPSRGHSRRTLSDDQALPSVRVLARTSGSARSLPGIGAGSSSLDGASSPIVAGGRGTAALKDQYQAAAVQHAHVRTLLLEEEHREKARAEEWRCVAHRRHCCRACPLTPSLTHCGQCSNADPRTRRMLHSQYKRERAEFLSEFQQAQAGASTVTQHALSAASSTFAVDTPPRTPNTGVRPRNSNGNGNGNGIDDGRNQSYSAFPEVPPDFPRLSPRDARPEDRGTLPAVAAVREEKSGSGGRQSPYSARQLQRQHAPAPQSPITTTPGVQGAHQEQQRQAPSLPQVRGSPAPLQDDAREPPPALDADALLYASNWDPYAEPEYIRRAKAAQDGPLYAPPNYLATKTTRATTSHGNRRHARRTPSRGALSPLHAGGAATPPRQYSERLAASPYTNRSGAPPPRVSTAPLHAQRGKGRPRTQGGGGPRHWHGDTPARGTGVGRGAVAERTRSGRRLQALGGATASPHGPPNGQPHHRRNGKQSGASTTAHELGMVSDVTARVAAAAAAVAAAEAAEAAEARAPPPPRKSKSAKKLKHGSGGAKARRSAAKPKGGKKGKRRRRARRKRGHKGKAQPPGSPIRLPPPQEAPPDSQGQRDGDHGGGAPPPAPPAAPLAPPPQAPFGGSQLPVVAETDSEGDSGTGSDFGSDSEDEGYGYDGSYQRNQPAPPGTPSTGAPTPDAIALARRRQQLQEKLARTKAEEDAELHGVGAEVVGTVGTEAAGPVSPVQPHTSTTQRDTATDHAAVTWQAVEQQAAIAPPAPVPPLASGRAQADGPASPPMQPSAPPPQRLSPGVPPAGGGPNPGTAAAGDFPALVQGVEAQPFVASQPPTGAGVDEMVPGLPPSEGRYNIVEDRVVIGGDAPTARTEAETEDAQSVDSRDTSATHTVLTHGVQRRNKILAQMKVKVLETLLAKQTLSMDVLPAFATVRTLYCVGSDEAVTTCT